jgi:Acetyltransferase (GNAT) domain
MLALDHPAATGSHAAVIKRFAIDDGDAWDRCVRQFGETTIFHSAGWSRVLQASYGHTPHWLALMDGDRARALLPLMEVHSLLKGRRGVAMPFSDEGGILSTTANDAGPLFGHAVELGRERGWKHLELRAPLADRADAPTSENYFGHDIDLEVGVERLFEKFESSVRRAIRKAEKSGVTTRVSRTVEAIRAYHDLHCRTRRKHGVPPQSLRFFENIFEHVIKPGSGFVMEAVHDGQLIAAGVFLHFGQKSLYKFGASEESRLHLRANDLVMWEAMKTCAALGCRTFSMGRTDPDNAGLRRFKSGFGATERTIRYQRFDLRQNVFRAELPHRGGTGGSLMRWLPMPLFRLAGRMLYPQMD